MVKLSLINQSIPVYITKKILAMLLVQHREIIVACDASML